MYDDILDLHTHTIVSGHAYNTLYEMAQAAKDCGLKLFGSSDHGPAVPGSCTKSYFANFPVIPRTLFGLPLLMGSELNIVDFEGNVDLPEYILERLDYSIASLHTSCLTPGSSQENTAAYLKALENPYVHIIGHPDDGRYPVNYRDLVSQSKRCGKLLEVNSSSLSPASFRPGARENYREMLDLCMEYEQPVIIGSDAHIASDVGNHRLALELLEELHFPPHLVVNSSMEKLACYLPSISQYGFGGAEK